MRSIRSVALAGWILEHLTFGSDNEALSGDLLEEFQLGRSALWYWRQAMAAVATRGLRWAAHGFALPLAFSAAWSMLYPLWRAIEQGSLAHATFDRWTGLIWPYSALVDLSYGLIPAISFVWLGLIIYLLLRAGAVNGLSAHGLVLGLSQSLTVLLGATITLLHHFKHPQVDLASMIISDRFYSTFHLGNISIPITLSLLAALLPITPGTPRISRRRRRLPSLIPGKVRRMGQFACVLLSLSLFTSAQAHPSEPSVQFVPVDQDVRLEVLDWGGTGQPLVFLAGLGNDAHVFNTFAPKFTANHHVYAITRRGFGASSKPAPENNNYAANRLGDDVLAVLDALKLNHPVLVGHSLAGEELSSIGSRHPDRVAGLIYLEAGYGYAFYDRVHGDPIFDFLSLEKQLDDFMSGSVRDDSKFMDDLTTNIAQLNKDLQEYQKRSSSGPLLHAPRNPTPPIIRAINLGKQKYADIPVPVLAIFACPRSFDFDPALRSDPKAKAAVVADNLFYTSRQADAFAAGVPTAHVVRLANADHYIFRSNEADVIQEMNRFLDNTRKP